MVVLQGWVGWGAPCANSLARARGRVQELAVPVVNQQWYLACCPTLEQREVQIGNATGEEGGRRQDT